MKFIPKIAFAAALLSVFPASAGVRELGKAFEGYTYILPSRFTFDKKTQLVIEAEDDNGDGGISTYTILDTKLNEIGTFSIPKKDVTGGPQTIDICSESSLEMGEVVVSQTLFNNDELYEWVIPTYTEDEDGNKVCKGFKVISQNGAVVASVDFPSGFTTETNYLDAQIYLLGEEVYLLADVHGEGEGEFYYIPYAVSAAEASVSQVAAPRRVSVRPTTPRRGTSVIVSIPEEFNGATLNVVSASGAVVMTKTIAAGQTSTEINTGTLPAGMYVVSVTDGEAAHEAAKIVVR